MTTSAYLPTSIHNYQDYYLHIAKYYDRLIGNRDEIPLLRSLIKKYHPKAKSLLELACGTGQVLEHFASNFNISGLDRSEAMLDIARKRIYPANFYHADMTNFRLKSKYDIVLCIFNSLNHLHKFSQWKSVFKMACQHLNPGGIFIFDINTFYGLGTYPDEEPLVQEQGDDFMSIQYFKAPRGMIDMQVDIFASQGQDKYKRYRALIREKAFQTPQVDKAVKLYFKGFHKIDPDRSKPSSKSEELIYIAKK